MSIVVICECGKEFQASAQYALARCPGCGRDLLLPPPRSSPFSVPKAFYPVDDEFTGPGWRGADAQVSGRAVASSVLGLIATVCALSIVLGPVFGIPAILLGRRALADIRSSRGHLTGRFLAWAGIVLGAVATLVIPTAMLGVGGFESREAARRTQCINNLKQIGLAMHNFHDREGHFPGPAITGTDGKPLLSWRVAILPDIEQRSLYSKFRLDEPWDSPHNKALLTEIPSIYVCPSDPRAESDVTTTRYQVFDGPGAAFENGRTFQVSDLLDGTSNTLMVVEARDPVPWTKPDDLTFDPMGPLPALGSEHTSGENALFCDGAVWFLRLSISQPVLRALITRNGGELQQKHE